MNICFFTGDMGNNGGTEHMTQLLANQLSYDENYNVFVLSKSLKEGKVFFPLKENIQFYVLDNQPFKGAISLIKEILFLNKFVKINNIDILINVDVSLGLFSLPLKILKPKLKQVFWEHFSFHFDIFSSRTKLLRKLALKFGDAYITLTPEDTQQFKCVIKKPCLICDIPNICSLSLSSQEYNLNCKRIVSVGNFNYAKGFDLALNVAEQVFEKHPDWSWDLYGDGAEFENLYNIAEQKNILTNFNFKGRVSDLNQIYTVASICVLPSRTEGFGLVLVEAQAYNLPTVAFDVPYGPRNIIKNGVNGYLIEPFNINEMATRICELIENPNLAIEFSKNASNDLEKYNAEKVAIQWKNLLGDL